MAVVKYEFMNRQNVSSMSQEPAPIMSNFPVLVPSHSNKPG